MTISNNTTGSQLLAGNFAAKCVAKLRASFTSLATAAVLTAASLAHGATVTSAAFVEGTMVTDWRTPATSKDANDIDGDNVFGTLGAIDWGNIDTGKKVSGSTEFGWALIGTVSPQAGALTPAATIDDLGGGADVTAGIDAVGSPGSFTFELTGTATDFAGTTFRIGVMADMLSAVDATEDNGKVYQLTQIVGGSSDSGPAILRNGNSGNGSPEMYFFDITNANPGDQFTLTAFSVGALPGYIGPVSFDSVPVPAPSAFPAGMALLSTLAAFRRRRNA